MGRFAALVRSSIGQKFLNGLTGVLLCAFVLLHLLGNLAIFAGPSAFNLYSDRLASLGELLLVIEIGLLAAFLIHIAAAVSVFLSKRRARPKGYHKVASAGPPSHKGIASTTMIYTGVLILVFTVLHLSTFKYGPYYVATHQGREVRDLYRLVVEVFTQGRYVIWYEAIMILLGLHLWHGFWSSFQSLGLNHPGYTPLIHAAGYAFALVVAVGFLAIPPYVYITGGVQ